MVPSPFKGGTLVPVPVVVPPTILATDPQGAITLSFVQSVGVPAGLDLYVQYAIQDAAAVLGVTLSNAIKGATP